MNTEEYLDKTQKEINKIEVDLKDTKKAKRKADLKRRILKALVIMKFCYPALITIILGTVGSYFLGVTPFYIDDKKETLRTKKEIDSFNNIRYESQYESYDEVNTISVVGTWNKLDDGLYERKTETYTLGSLNEEEIIKIINGEKQFDSIEELFDKKPIIKKEGKNKLNEEDLYNSPYLQATIYSEDKDDIVVVRESATDNLAESVFITLLIVLLALVAAYARGKIKNNKDFLDGISEEFDTLNEKYTFDEEAIEHLKKVLETKKDNYNTLVRKL